MKVYEHHAQYYETDQMGIIHHSNYIRWMEEARVDYMEQMGYGYRRMEEEGVMSPVLEVHGEYKTMTHFDDTVCISVTIKEYKGVRLTIGYEITDKKTGELRFLGESKHCFLDMDGHPVRMKKKLPKLDQMLREACEV